MKIQKTINDAILKEQEERKDRKGSGLWKPSQLGRCYRLQVFAREGIPPTNPPDIPSVKRMDLGTLIHKYIQDKFDKKQVEIEVKAKDVYGFADLVSEDTVADIKTVTDWSYKFIAKANLEKIRKEKVTNWLQVATYGLILKKPKVKLFFVNIKDINKVQEFEDDLSYWQPKVNEEFKALRHWWTQDLPPAEPRAFNGKDCDYCAWKDYCKGVEDGTIKYCKGNREKDFTTGESTEKAPGDSGRQS